MEDGGAHVHLASPVCFRWISYTLISWVQANLEWKLVMCKYSNFTDVASWVVAGLGMNYVFCLMMLMTVWLGLVGLILQQKHVDYWHLRHCWGDTAESLNKSRASAQAATTGWGDEADDASSHYVAPDRWSGKLSVPLSVSELSFRLPQPSLLHPLCCWATGRRHSKTWVEPWASATLELDM